MSDLIESFDDLCRLCAVKIDAPMAFNVCDADQRGLLKKINTCLPIEVTVADHFPKVVCMECACKMDLIFEFRERCLLTAHLFEEMISSGGHHVLILPDAEETAMITSKDFQAAEEVSCNFLDDEKPLPLDEESLSHLPEPEKPAVVVEHLPSATNGVREEKEEFILLESVSEAILKESRCDVEASGTSNETVSTAKTKSDKGKCNECGKVCASNYKLHEHMRRHTGEKPFKCSYHLCNKTFRSKIGLAQHEANHSGQFEFSCKICGKGFQCKSYLVVHQRVHSDAKPFPCEQCNRSFKTKHSLQDHVNRHLGVKPFLCDICGRGFITKGLCKSHQKVHSGTDNRQFPCHICLKLFVSKSYLNTHLRIHTGDKPYMCEVCGKNFITRVDLKIHSTMHTGEKSFVCETCGKAFARRDALRCHRRSHTGERPYKCEFCGQSFTQFSPMAIHKRLHTGERPYTCDICSKSFVSRSTLTSHSRKHHNKDGKSKDSKLVKGSGGFGENISFDLQVVDDPESPLKDQSFSFSDRALKVEMLDMGCMEQKIILMKSVGHTIN